MKMKRFIKAKGITRSNDPYFFNGTYTRNEVPSDYVYEEGDEEFDMNKKFLNKNTKTIDWVNYALEPQERKRFYSWDSLTKDEKSSIVHNGNFLDKIINKYLDNIVNNTKKFIENELYCEFNLEKSNVEIGYDNDFYINILFDFNVIDSDMDNEKYEYSTVNGTVVASNLSGTDDELFTRLIPKKVKDLVQFNYKLILDSIEDDFKYHTYTEEEKELLKRTSSAIKKVLRKLAVKKELYRGL